MSAPAEAVEDVAAPTRLLHPRGCWRFEGHHGCAIRRVERLETSNLLRAFSKRGAMLKAMSQQNAKLHQTIDRLSRALKRGTR